MIRQKLNVNGMLFDLVEKFVRSNPFTYAIIRWLAGWLLYKQLGEKDISFIKYLPFKNEFPLIIDIGANDGISSRLFKWNLPSSRIIAFEPASIHKKNLKSYFANLHKIDGFSYVIFEGLGEQNTQSTLYTPMVFGIKLHQISSLNPDEASKNVKEIISFFTSTFKLYSELITISTLDNFDLSPDLIKIDVEGNELNVLKGSINTLLKFKPFVVLEMKKEYANKIFEFMYSIGYEPIKFNDKQWRYVDINFDESNSYVENQYFAPNNVFKENIE